MEYRNRWHRRMVCLVFSAAAVGGWVPVFAGGPGSNEPTIDVRPEPAIAIPEGHRAYAVRINALLSVDRLVGERVDIILHYKKDGSETKLILVKDALVLTITSPKSDDGANPGQTTLITFALRGEGVLTVATAKERGTLRIALPERVEALIAQHDLAIGEVMKQPDKLFAKKSIRKDECPKNAISALGELKDRALKRPLRKGAVVTRQDLLKPDEKPALSIPEGHRAYALRVNIEVPHSALAVLPHSRFALVHSAKEKKGDKTIHRIAVNNVLVLAFDDEPTTKDGIEHIITVAVTPQVASELEASRDSRTFTLVQ